MSPNTEEQQWLWGVLLANLKQVSLLPEATGEDEGGPAPASALPVKGKMREERVARRASWVL